MKKGLSWEEHIEAGRTLRAVRGMVQGLGVKVCNAYSKNLGAELFRAVDMVDRARCKLDSQVFREFPEMETKVLASAYYGREGK